MHRRVVLMGVILVASIGWTRPAWANAGGIASTSGDGVDSVASNSSRDGGGQAASSPSHCSWTPASPDDNAAANTSGGYSEVDGLADPVFVPPNTPGRWYWVSCDYYSETYFIFVPQGAGVSPAQLASQAKRHLPLEPPKIELAPSAATWQYVNTQTWLWVAAGTWTVRQSVASVPGVTVTVDAVPQRVEWTIENGIIENGIPKVDTVTCMGPGTPFNPAVAEDQQSTDCGYLWRRSSASSSDERLGITARVFYHVTWTVTGAPGGGDLGLLPSAPTTVRVTVGEIQTVARAND